MALPLIPIVLGVLATGAFIKAGRRGPKALKDSERAEITVIYDTLINGKYDPETYRRFATEFRVQGMVVEADMLDKRATLREMTAEEKAQRRAIFKKGMASQKPEIMRELAEEFERSGATGAAADLRNKAALLDIAGVPPHAETGSQPEGVVSHGE